MWCYDRYICDCCGHFVKFDTDDSIKYCGKCGVPVKSNPGRVSYHDIIKRLYKEPNQERTVNKDAVERALGVRF